MSVIAIGPSFETALVPARGTYDKAGDFCHDSIQEDVLQECYTALKTATIGEQVPSRRILPPEEPFDFEQVTDLREQAPHLVDPQLSKAFQKVVLSKDDYGTVDSFLHGNDKAKESLQRRGFKLITIKKGKKDVAQYPERIQHSSKEVQGYSLLSMKRPEGIKNRAGETNAGRYNALQRVVLCQAMQRAIDQEDLAVVLPEYHVIDLSKHADKTAAPHHRYFVAVRELRVPSMADSIKNFQRLPLKIKERLAHDLCRLVVKTGFSNLSNENVRIVLDNPKHPEKGARVHIRSTDPLGLMRDERGDDSMATVDVVKGAKIGLLRIMTKFDMRLHVFQLAAAKYKQELDERSLFSTSGIRAFRTFRTLMLRKNTTSERQLAAFKKLPIQLQEFFELIVWKACGAPRNEYEFGAKLLEKDITYLVRIRSASGETLFDQYETRLSIYTMREILKDIKRSLLNPGTNAKAFQNTMESVLNEMRNHPLLKYVGIRLSNEFDGAPKDPQDYLEFCKDIFFAGIQAGRDVGYVTIVPGDEELPDVDPEQGIISVDKEHRLVKRVLTKQELAAQAEREDRRSPPLKKGQLRTDCLIDRWIKVFDAANFEMMQTQARDRLRDTKDMVFVPTEPSPKVAIQPERFLPPDHPNAVELPQQFVHQNLLTQEQLARRLNVLVVAYECAKVGLSYGGLANAVWDQGKSLQELGHDVTFIVPLFDSLPANITKDLRVLYRLNYSTKAKKEDADPQPRAITIYTNDGKGGPDGKTKVLYIEDTWGKESDRCTVTVDGQQVERNRDRFSVKDGSTIYEDGILTEREKWRGLKERMLVFSLGVYQYILRNIELRDRKPGMVHEAVIYNDWHGVYAFHRLTVRHIDRPLPASVFVIHNNNFGCQGVYAGEALELIRLSGDDRQTSVNIMIDVLRSRKMNQLMTVSETFSVEMQGEKIDAGLGSLIRQQVYPQPGAAGRFSGITNGSNPEIWNPANNSTLRDWVDPDTGEAIDLRFSSKSPDIFAKKAEARRQLQLALFKYYPQIAGTKAKPRFDVTQGELIMYVGRYDSEQKGIEMFKHVYREARVRGAKLIVMGVNEDPNALQMLDALEEEVNKHAEEDGFASAWITRGRPGENASLKMQIGNANPAKGPIIPALGALIRAGSSIGIVPSKFEPCGLTPWEIILFAGVVVADRTGGLADIVIDDPEADNFNGYFFERMRDFETEEQAGLCREAIGNALDYMETPEEERLPRLQRAMDYALSCSWTTAPAGRLPAAEKYSILLNAAVVDNERGIQPSQVDLFQRKEIPDGPEDGLLAEFSPRDLHEFLGAHVIDDEACEVWEPMREKLKTPMKAIRSDGEVVEGRLLFVDGEPQVIDDDLVDGVRFAVWAPRARDVSVSLKIGAREVLIAMRPLQNGIWGIEVPKSVVENIGVGQIYEFEITTAQGEKVRHMDPAAYAYEARPLRGSIVGNPKVHQWQDAEWMDKRVADAGKEKPIMTLEVLLGAWRRDSNDRWLNYRQYAHLLVDWCKQFNYTAVELMGILEYPADESWGYQVKGLFAPTTRYGNLEDFQYMVDHLHQNGIAVFLDATYYHFASDKEGFAAFDGTALFEINRGYEKTTRDNWGTGVFDHSRADIRKFCHASVHHMLEYFHIDGFRWDAVSCLTSTQKFKTWQWGINQHGNFDNLGGIRFLQDANDMIRDEFPGVLTMSENSHVLPNTRNDTAPRSEGGLGCDRRWDMIGMHVVKHWAKLSDANRTKHFPQFIREFGFDRGGMLQMSEHSHDEIAANGNKCVWDMVHGTEAQKVAQYKTFLAMKAFQPACGVLLFAGIDTGEPDVWRATRELFWSEIQASPARQAIIKTAVAVNATYTTYSAFWSTGVKFSRFEYVDYQKDHLIVAYHRMSDQGKRFAVIHNFSKKAFQGPLKFKNQGRVAKLKSMVETLNTDHPALDGSGNYMNDDIEIFKGQDGARRFNVAVAPYATVVLEEIDIDDEDQAAS